MAAMILDGMQNVMAGLTPARDKAMNVTYSKAQHLVSTLEAMYADSPIAKAVVDQIPDDSFRKWRTWQGEDNQVTLIEALEKKLKVKQTLNWVDKMSRLYGEHYAYIDVGQPPDTPLIPASVGKDGLRFVIPMSKGQLVPGDYETDPLSPEYGRPMYYQVSSLSHGMINIHPSRIIRMFGSEVPSQGYGFQQGDSVLQSMMTSVMQYDGVMANVASLVYEAKIDILEIPDLMAQLETPESERTFISAMNTIMAAKGNNGVLMLPGASSKDGVGAVYSQKQMSFATLPDIIDRFQANVAGAANSNRARMFGVSAGGLGSNGNLELSTYYDYVNSRQVNYLEPALTILDECIIRSALGSRPADLWYQWNSLWQISDKEKAEIGEKIANTAKTLSDSGVIPAEVLSEPVTLALVQAGVMPGLDQSLEDFIASGGDVDPEPDVEELPPVQKEVVKDAEPEPEHEMTEKEKLEIDAMQAALKYLAGD